MPRCSVVAASPVYNWSCYGRGWPGESTDVRGLVQDGPLCAERLHAARRCVDGHGAQLHLTASSTLASRLACLLACLSANRLCDRRRQESQRGRGARGKGPGDGRRLARVRKRHKGRSHGQGGIVADQTKVPKVQVGASRLRWRAGSAQRRIQAGAARRHPPSDCTALHCAGLLVPRSPPVCRSALPSPRRGRVDGCSRGLVSEGFAAARRSDTPTSSRYLQ